MVPALRACRGDLVRMGEYMVTAAFELLGIVIMTGAWVALVLAVG